MNANTQKVITYTIEEAANFVKENDLTIYSALVLHLITNDVKNAEPNTVSTNIISMTEDIGKSAPGTKIVSSLCPAREDSKELHTKCQIVNETLLQYASAKHHINVCAHQTLPDPSTPDWQQYFRRDRVHPNEAGTAIIAANIRRCTEAALNIKSTWHRKPYTRQIRRDSTYSSDSTNINFFKCNINPKSYNTNINISNPVHQVIPTV